MEEKKDKKLDSLLDNFGIDIDADGTLKPTTVEKEKSNYKPYSDLSSDNLTKPTSTKEENKYALKDLSDGVVFDADKKEEPTIKTENNETPDGVGNIEATSVGENADNEKVPDEEIFEDKPIDIPKTESEYAETPLSDEEIFEENPIEINTKSDNQQNADIQQNPNPFAREAGIPAPKPAEPQKQNPEKSEAKNDDVKKEDAKKEEGQEEKKEDAPAEKKTEKKKNDDWDKVYRPTITLISVLGGSIIIGMAMFGIPFLGLPLAGVFGIGFGLAVGMPLVLNIVENIQYGISSKLKVSKEKRKAKEAKKDKTKIKAKSKAKTINARNIYGDNKQWKQEKLLAKKHKQEEKNRQNEFRRKRKKLSKHDLVFNTNKDYDPIMSAIEKGEVEVKKSKNGLYQLGNLPPKNTNLKENTFGDTTATTRLTPEQKLQKENLRKANRISTFGNENSTSLLRNKKLTEGKVKIIEDERQK